MVTQPFIIQYDRMWIWKPSILLAVGLGIFFWPAKEPAPVQAPSWSTPRTITALNGQVFRNVTIRNLTSDGGAIINHASNAIKIPGNLLSKEDMAMIVSAAPASGMHRSPYTINENSFLRPHSYKKTHSAAPSQSLPRRFSQSPSPSQSPDQSPKQAGLQALPNSPE